MSNIYKVKPFNCTIDIDVNVPGSKSMTNRALLLAALADGRSRLLGAGMSDDSRVFFDAMKSLGIDVSMEKKGMDGGEGEGISVGNNNSDVIYVSGCGADIPNKEGEVYVGSAGTAARFITAMLGLSDGCYHVTSSEQMKQRPMRELIEALELMGAAFSFDEEKYHFPFTVTGRRHADKDAELKTKCIPLNIDRSSQFLSALLLCAPMVEEGFTVKLTGKRKARSYVVITERMMKDFGYDIPPGSGDDDMSGKNTATVSAPDEYEADSPDIYRIAPGVRYTAREYEIEPDVSAACYFYAMAALNGGRAVVRGVHPDNSQGDMRFLDVLKAMGCEVNNRDTGIEVKRAPDTPLTGIDINMSDFSDQTMTLAAIAPFASSETTIRGVAHIRGQESDRISAIVTELKRIGVRCEEYDDGMRIWPMDKGAVSAGEIVIETYDDHRMAMAFAVAGTGIGLTISDPDCCKKTFAGFFDILDDICYN
ncbi:MAG: 3-phosphoshikimate 1-carboxyvinyltransferase [Eubacterium sp.]|nr:3-phosphoshikimate 1-carboxyvinyltransferase [Eubacterium sp.]